MEDGTEFRSQDFYLVSILLASKKLSLKRLDRSSGKFATFILHDPQNKAEEIIRAHWDRSNKAPTRDVIEAINELRTRLHSKI